MIICKPEWSYVFITKCNAIVLLFVGCLKTWIPATLFLGTIIVLVALSLTSAIWSNFQLGKKKFKLSVHFLFVVQQRFIYLLPIHIVKYASNPFLCIFIGDLQIRSSLWYWFVSASIRLAEENTKEKGFRKWWLTFMHDGLYAHILCMYNSYFVISLLLCRKMPMFNCLISLLAIIWNNKKIN